MPVSGEQLAVGPTHNTCIGLTTGMASSQDCNSNTSIYDVMVDHAGVRGLRTAGTHRCQNSERRQN